MAEFAHTEAFDDHMFEHLSHAEADGLRNALTGLCLLPENPRTSSLFHLVLEAFSTEPEDRTDAQAEVVREFADPSNYCNWQNAREVTQ